MRTRSLALAAAGVLMAGGPSLAQSANPVVTTLSVFAGSAAGLWQSKDWGGSWQLVKVSKDASLEGLGAAYCILPQGPRVYACGEAGVFTSEDFGASWRRAAIEGPVQVLLASRYAAADPTVFAGTPRGLSISQDAGLTFPEVSLPGTAVSRLEWPGPELVLATSRGVLVSSDAGRTFRGPGPGLPEGQVAALALSSFFGTDPVLFAAVGQGGVYRSSDGARSWAPSGLQGRAVNDLAWLGPLLYAATDRGLYRSDDAGKTWSPLGKELAEREVTRLLFPLMPASGAEVFAGTDQGIYRSSDGGLNWIRTSFPKERVLALATYPAALPAGKPKRTP
ncbi:MAG TPA: hypothetical protein VJU18_03195 [Vicinamibacteria bacterium]|nr:hypothetical protein [Vicinamibacteria bacterium]